MVDPPFRWNLSRRNELGSLLGSESPRGLDWLVDSLLPLSSRMLAFAGDADWVFVGRSPDTAFDLLSGLLFELPWQERLVLLQFSMYSADAATLRRENPQAIDAIRDYLRQLDLHPHGIATRVRPVAFIDLVQRGHTFGHLLGLLHHWALEERHDWNAVRRRLRIIGIVEQEKNSPKTWRWQQHATWLAPLGRLAIKNVSVPRMLWWCLADSIRKATPSHTPQRWAAEDLARASHDPERLEGLRYSFHCFEQGLSRERRAQFAALLIKEPAMDQAWFRALAHDCKR